MQRISKEIEPLDDLKFLPAAVALLIGLAIWFVIPVPEGVTPEAWHLLALFVGTIAGIIGKAMPIGALALLAIALVAVTGVTNQSPGGASADALSGFSNPLIWLIGVAIMISRGLIKTGLVALAIMPLALYVIAKPEVKNTPEAHEFARSKLAELGTMNAGEKIMLGIFALLLLLWAGVPAMVFGPAVSNPPSAVCC